MTTNTMSIFLFDEHNEFINSDGTIIDGYTIIGGYIDGYNGLVQDHDYYAFDDADGDDDDMM